MPERELDSVRRQFGMLFQSAALFDSLTVGENVGLGLREHLRLDDAEVHYRRALELSPETADVHTGYGVLLARRGRFEDAVAALKRALAIDPLNDEARFDLARVLEEQGNIGAARAEYERVSAAEQPSEVRSAARKRLQAGDAMLMLEEGLRGTGAGGGPGHVLGLEVVDLAFWEQKLRAATKVNLEKLAAEQVKIQLGSAYPVAEMEPMEVRGREITTGMPKAVRITQEELRETMSETVEAIVAAARDCLASSPPELGHDVLERGMFLTGGGALLRGLDMRIAQECEVPVHLTDQPLETVVLGAGRCLELLAESSQLFAATPWLR